MNNLAYLNQQLDNYLGYTERVRLKEEERLMAINEALKIVYSLLNGSPILKRTSTITLTQDGTEGVATPPTNFNEGSILFVGDSSTWDDSDEVFEVDEQMYGRYDNDDIDVLVQRFNSTTGALEFRVKGIVNGTLYFEYEMGAPTLSNSSDFDNLPIGTAVATAKVAAGILTDNVLSDSTKMQLMLYGPSGNSSRYSPDSIYGVLQRVMKQRSISKQSPRFTQPRIIINNRLR